MIFYDKLCFFDFVVIFIYFALILFPWSKASQNSDDYFLAGRKLTLPFFVASLVSTWYGNLLGVSEMAYKNGLGEFLTQGLFWYLGYFVFVFFFVKKIREDKYFTIPDILQKAFGTKVAIFGALITLILQNPVTYLISLALIFEFIFGLPKNLSIIIALICPLFYSLKGGFKSIVYTDFIQFIFMFLGLAIILPFTLSKYALSELIFKIPDSHLHIGGGLSKEILLAWFFISLWTFVDTGFYQRTLAAKDSKTARQGILVSIVFWFIFDLMICCIGLLAKASDPNLDPTICLPLFAMKVLPSGFRGLFLAGILATFMSTFDSLLFSSSMCMTKDLYQKITGNNDEKLLIKFNRLAIFITILIALLLSFYFQSLVQLMYYKGSFAISTLLIPLFLALFYPQKFHQKSIFASMLGGSLGLALGLIAKHYNLIKIEAIFIALICAIVFLLANQIFQNISKNTINKFGTF